MQQWQLQEAKAKFSELIRQTKKSGPQLITTRGEPVAVILSISAFEDTIKPQDSLIDFLNNSPIKGIVLDLKRDQSLDRDIDL